MKHIRCRNAVVLLAGVMGVGAAQAQTVKAQEGAKAATPIPAITDWSSRSVIFHNPKTPDEFARGAAGDAEMARLYRDPRYTAQLLRRLDSEASRPAPERTTLASAGKAASTQTAVCDDRRRGHCDNTPSPAPGTQGYDELVHRDWSNVIGGAAGGSGALGMYPAKYNFDIFAAPSCANDFVVYGTNAASATDSAGTKQIWSGTFTATDDATGTITIGYGGGRSVTLTASTSDNTGLNYQVATGTTNTVRNQKRDNLVLAINRWSGITGLTAAAGGTGVVNVTATASSAASMTTSLTSGGAGFGGFTVSTTGTGTAGQPSIIAFNQLYNTTCNAGRTKVDAPNVMWAYNTGTGYIVETSPVLSYFDNGRQVAYLQRSGTTLQLVLLKWVAGQGTASAPVTPDFSYQSSTNGADALYRYCTTQPNTSCSYTITLNGSSNPNATATYSSPFVEYATDVLWVGDGNGRLHKFTGVFQGSPAEASGNFPAQVIAGANNGIQLSPPVALDGQVYVGSQSGGAGIGGKVHRVDAISGAVVSSAKLANDNSTGFRESLIATFAPTATGGSVFAFLFNDGSGGNGSTCVTTQSSNACRIVARFNPGFATDAAPVERAYVGRGNSTVSTLYAGSLDDAYYTSTNGTGAMYIVGGAYNDTFTPTLWKIPLIAGVMQLPLAGPVVGSNDCNTVGDCLTNNWDWSPVTTSMNGTAEYLYFSMGKKGNATGCTGACMYMFNLNDLGTHETWTFTVVSGFGNGANGNYVRITSPATNNTQVQITAGNAQSCTATGGTFQRTNNQTSDADNLRACLALVPGFTMSGTGSTIVLTAIEPGNVNYSVTENFSTFDLTLANSDGASATAWATNNLARASLSIPGGTGGIIVDNVQSTNNNNVTGTQQIYTTGAGTVGNAVQASQSGLQ